MERKKHGNGTHMREEKKSPKPNKIRRKEKNPGKGSMEKNQYWVKKLNLSICNYYSKNGFE